MGSKCPSSVLTGFDVESTSRDHHVLGSVYYGAPNYHDSSAIFFNHRTPVLKPEQRIRKRFVHRNKKGGIALENLTHHHKGGLLQGNIHIIEPGVASDGQIEHHGEEMGYVLEGEIALYLGEEIYTLSVGDSFYFPSNVPHGYRNIGQSTAKVLWVNTPVTF
uniref:Cupin type-2 domain-containing protein n=1 Tax=Yersinia enterocolitica W22703 TaxID=913028 RepID=F4MVP1_YEREN|nr:hypothetical protein YEW_KP45100 [Yersinia enterocolitica W22703]